MTVAEYNTRLARVEEKARLLADLNAQLAALPMPRPSLQAAHEPFRVTPERSPSVAGDPVAEATAAAETLKGILPIPPFDPAMPDAQREKILGSETLAGIVHMVPNAAQAVADIFTLSNPLNPGRGEAMERLRNKPILQTASEVLMAVGLVSGGTGVAGKMMNRPKSVIPAAEPSAPFKVSEVQTGKVAPREIPVVEQSPTPAPPVERLAPSDAAPAMTRAGSESGVGAEPVQAHPYKNHPALVDALDKLNRERGDFEGDVSGRVTYTVDEYHKLPSERKAELGQPIAGYDSANLRKITQEQYDRMTPSEKLKVTRDPLDTEGGHKYYLGKKKNVGDAGTSGDFSEGLEFNAPADPQTLSVRHDRTALEKAVAGEPMTKAQIERAQYYVDESRRLQSEEAAAMGVSESVAGEKVSLRKGDAERIYKDMIGEDIPETQKRGWVEDVTRAREEGLKDNIENVVGAARSSDRPLSSKEHAAAIDRMNDLVQELRESDQAFSRAQYTPEADIHFQTSETLRARIAKFAEDMQNARSESGRSLAIGRMAIDEADGSVGAVLQRATKRKGSRLTPAEVKQFEASATEINALKERLKVVEAENIELASTRDKILAERITAQEKQRAKIQRRTAALRDKLAAEQAKLEKELAAMGNRMNSIVGPPHDALWRVGRLAVIEIRKGAASLDEVAATLKAKFPDLTDRDVWDAMNARSPKARQIAKSAAEKNLAEFKTQANLLSQIDDLVKGVESVKPEHRRDVSAQIKALQKRLAELKASAYKSNLPADRLQAAIETMDRAQDMLIRQYRAVKKGKPVDTPEIAQVRELTGQLRRRMRAEDQIADIQEQIRTGEFKDARPYKPYVSPELEQAQLQLRRARTKQRDLMEGLRPKTTGEKIADIAQTPRAAMAGGDMSGALRQNVVQMVAHPVRGVQAFTKAVKAWGSRLSDEKIHNQIENSPNVLKYEQSGLKIQARDETFNSTWLEKIPKLGEFWASGNRHMTTLGNVMRTSLFDDFLAKNPNATKPELQAYADFLNKSTGIGNVGLGAEKLGKVFFSPRLLYSRFQTPAALFQRGISSRVRKQMASDFGKFIGTGMTTLAIAKMAGADVTLDPESPDFGKIRVGDKRVDIWGGFQQPVRLVLSIGEKGLRKGGAIDPDLPESDKDFDPLDMAFRFLSYKFSPNITLPVEAIKGESAVGEERTGWETAARAFVPLYMQDAYDSYKEEGIGSALTSAGLSYFGVGVNTYGDSEGTVRRQIREAKDKGDTAEARRLQQEWNAANPNDRISEVSDTRGLVLGDIKRAVAEKDMEKARKIQENWNAKHPDQKIVYVK